ncbi:hypothetical protein EDB81DRAFT_926865 [Dactylonectria macrodidyma]|uniref:Uncharacterized protein n=1 Tax=Dactylonectria macrodidyma TaxID=307937 RepID=A0A9P9D1G5_9HYPO|nr:hypothetical protein EDB81DRAFT_926865 [Dactylonectria macrodidyma]
MTSLANAAPLLTNVFGKTGDVGDLVKNFDFSKISVNDTKSDEFLHTDLAPSFGKLNKDSLKEIDDKLKIMIAGTMKVLGRQTDKSWKAVLSTMMQNELLEPDSAEVARADKLIKESSNDFKFDGGADSSIVREVQTWFSNLISDADVLESTKIDIDVLANIVAQTGATVDSFESFFAKDEHHEQTLIDIGVLRFPDIDRPFFKLYRIKLVAWSDSSRILFHQEDRNGITGEFNSRIFRPRASVINSLTESARGKAIAAANALFDD